MIDTQPFGGIHANIFNPGDLVKWSIWNKGTGTWDKKYGVIIKIKNKIDEESNRMVSVSEVYAYEDDEIKQLFTLTLKKVVSNEEYSGSYRHIG
jgi:hypothetical protein